MSKGKTLKRGSGHNIRQSRGSAWTKKELGRDANMRVGLPSEGIIQRGGRSWLESATDGKKKECYSTPGGWGEKFLTSPKKFPKKGREFAAEREKG